MECIKNTPLYFIYTIRARTNSGLAMVADDDDERAISSSSRRGSFPTVPLLLLLVTSQPNNNHTRTSQLLLHSLGPKLARLNLSPFSLCDMNVDHRFHSLSFLASRHPSIVLYDGGPQHTTQKTCHLALIITCGQKGVDGC